MRARGAGSSSDMRAMCGMLRRQAGRDVGWALSVTAWCRSSRICSRMPPSTHAAAATSESCSPRSVPRRRWPHITLADAREGQLQAAYRRKEQSAKARADTFKKRRPFRDSQSGPEHLRHAARSAREGGSKGRVSHGASSVPRHRATPTRGAVTGPVKDRRGSPLWRARPKSRSK